MALTDVPFADRTDAGVKLARLIRKLKLRPPVRVLGLPRGGVPVAREVARVLETPLDVMAVRKVGMPGESELAIGAVAPFGIVVRDPYARELAPGNQAFEALALAEQVELERRERAYRAGLPPLALQGCTVVLVDDGLATGMTMLAAVRAARRAGATTVVAAAPVGSAQAATLLGPETDRVEILRIPPALYSVGEWYRDFSQIEDAEVLRILIEARASAQPAGAHEDTSQS
jgi:predicted phosphoribosyltransferase